MNFVDAVRVCFSKYAEFNGCAARPEFWWWILFSVIVSSVLQALSYNASAAFSIATFLPTVAVTSRRLHDTDRSGWLQLLWFIPLIGWVILIIWCAEAGKPNRYAGGTQTAQT